MTYVITESCVDIMDRRCVQECPVDCIYEGGRAMYINPVECIECGACEWVCPVSAISLDLELPEEDEHLPARAQEWVDAHQAVGGAGQRGRVGVDHPAIALLARKAEPGD
jgi:NAD-dependent dihydropyrimidine dehydrogenase PreA subunit